MSDRSIRSIAIAGGGIVGLSAALAFAKWAPRTEIVLVASPIPPAALADRMPSAWPGVARFHALLGLDELDLVRRGIATHHLGTIVENWTGHGARWVHAFAPHGKPVGGIPFDQVWNQVPEQGPYDCYSVGAALASAGKFVHPAGDPNALPSRFSYGLQLDPERYLDMLRAAAATAGVHITVGEIGNVERREDGGIARVVLVGGRKVQADLFIDCSGPQGALISEVDGSFEDWPSHRGRTIDMGSTMAATPTSAARIRATKFGWSGEWPLLDRTITCKVGEKGATALRPGHRPRPWSRNVLALGDAAVAIDPLHGLNLALVHHALHLAFDLLPGRDFHEVELAEFNRRFALISGQVRDFLALHYVRSDRETADLPESLVTIMDQYGYRGRLPFQEEEVLTRDDWTAALIGLGMRPQIIDPSAAAAPLEQVVPAMEDLSAAIAGFVERAPSYPDYLKRLVG